ncbi:MAG TPA: GNAT family N-acetyltransferase [Ktedonobacterales bacterium]
MTDDTNSNANVLAHVFDIVRTERLVLRRPNAGDALAFFQIDGNPATNRFNPAGPAPDLAASAARLDEWLRQWQEDGFGYWALAVPPDSVVMGFGGVRRIIWRDQTVLNLYYKLQPAIWRHGYGAELARTTVSLAQTHLPHLPIIARTRPDNLASQRTAERAGLLRRPDLDTAEHVIFALEWQAPTFG